MTDTSQAKEAFGQATSTMAKGNTEESISGFSKAIELDPGFTLAYLSRGVAHMQTQQIDKAMDDFNKALEIKPDYDRAHHLKGSAHFTKGEYDEAIRHFDQAIRINGEYGAAYLSRANAHAARGDSEHAEEDLKTATQLGEKNVQEFAADNNIWRSQHLRVEAEGIASEMER